MNWLAIASFITIWVFALSAWEIKGRYGIDVYRNPPLFYLAMMNAMIRGVLVAVCFHVIPFIIWR